MAVITKGIELCILGFEIIVEISLCFMTAILIFMHFSQVFRQSLPSWQIKESGKRKAFQKRGQQLWYKMTKCREEYTELRDSRAPDHVCIQLLWQVLMSFDRVPFLGLEDRGHILRRILLLLEWILRVLFLLTKEMFSFLFPHSRLKKSIIKITHRSDRARLRWKSKLDRLSFIGFPHRIKHSDASLIYNCYGNLFVYFLLSVRASFAFFILLCCE